MKIKNIETKLRALFAEYWECKEVSDALAIRMNEIKTELHTLATKNNLYKGKTATFETNKLQISTTKKLGFGENFDKQKFMKKYSLYSQLVIDEKKLKEDIENGIFKSKEIEILEHEYLNIRKS